MLVVKLGGSAITDKGVTCKARPGIIDRLARELEPCAGELILVHGAGSFGHIAAKKYGLKAGLTSRRSLLGAAEVQRDVRELNLMVCGALRKAGVPAVSIPPFPLVRFNAGSLSSYDVKPFYDALAKGFVPVTFGDVVLDVQQGVAICSGDVLMALLASEFKAEKAIFVSDVDGVFSADPKRDANARLLEDINPLKPPKLQPRSNDCGKRREAGHTARSRRVSDVTGAMAGKLQTALDIAALGCDVFIVNGTVKGRLAALLAGGNGCWTRIGGI